jgi:hypothetical protein
LQSTLDSNLLAAVLGVNSNVVSGLGALNSTGFYTNQTLVPNTNIVSAFPSFSPPSLSPVSPALDVPFSALNSYLPGGVAGFSDLTLDWSTESFWGAYVAEFRGFELLLVSLGFLFLCIRTVKGISG